MSGRALVALLALFAAAPSAAHAHGREAALACPERFVPVDAAIVGYVEAAWNGERRLGREARGDAR